MPTANLQTISFISPLQSLLKHDKNLVLAAAFSLMAGWTDWRSRRIPNWLTVPGLAVGILANSIIFRWAGCKSALLGAGLGLLLLLPL